ncbi:hypothetical protein COT57_01825 [Candidatus Micrarchaeota archaeon CG09_land_8_20_14_0_10_55_25]|nr:MAG: hypothetical protein AUJ15_04230 [Candidatus Micrarchaeota archaeon CG1_02_55_41]PIO02869.1 MAG: hypothetical protein COT57_01825 [Candidatus Micrarchaeota archaeon CG09_land_8_20_14_0_10_55_25]
MVIEASLLNAILLGAMPISEVRGAVIYALSVGQPWMIIPAAIANILAAVVLLLVWDLLRVERIGMFVLGKHLHKKVANASAKYEHYGVLGLALFIGIPLPVTGVYTGVLVAKIFGLKKRVILAASIIGVCFSALVSYAVVSGALTLL